MANIAMIIGATGAAVAIMGIVGLIRPNLVGLRTRQTAHVLAMGGIAVASLGPIIASLLVNL